MQNYKEINGNDYVKDSRTTINETMRSIQSMNSGTVFPTTNLFEGMKCYRTDLKKTYTLTDVENNTWVEDDIASKLSTARKINITGNATGAANFDGSSDANISVSVSQAAHADNADNTTHAAAADTLVGSTTILKNDIDTVNNSDTWIPVISNGKIQHTEKLNMKVGAAVNADKLGGYPLNGSSTDGSWGTVPRVGNDGVIEVGRYIDWHATNGGGADYTARFEAQDNGTVSVGTINGTLNGTATNADTVDGVHAGSMFYNKGDWAADNWATMGTYQVNNNPPNGNWYGWGQVISSSTNDARFQLYASDQYGGDGRLHYRTGWDDGKRDWNTILDSENYNIFAPTKTGSGASGTWPISISGNADTVDGYHASDIINRITAANTGGIVAASLTENGYVKFANGLILQWGHTVVLGRGRTLSFTYPVAMSAIYFAACNPITNKSGDRDSLVMSMTVSSCQIANYTENDGKVFVFVVGQA